MEFKNINKCQMNKKSYNHNKSKNTKEIFTLMKLLKTFYYKTFI